MPHQPTQEATRRILESSGTLIENDHFVYASGDHGSGWIAKDLINLRPELTHELSQLLAQEIRRHGLQPGLKKPARFAKMPDQSMFSTPMEQNLASDDKALIFEKSLHWRSLQIQALFG